MQHLAHGRPQRRGLREAPTSGVEGGGCRGCKCSLKFSFVDSLGKSPENLGKIPEIWTECLEIRVKRHPTFLTRKSGGRRLQKNT